MEYYYSTEAAENLQDQVLDLLPEDAKVIDTVDWSDEKKKEFYHETLVPLSAKTKKALKGRVKTHKAGTIHFTDGVLVTGDNFYVGEEAFQPLGNQIALVEDGIVDKNLINEDRARITFEKCRQIREAGVTFVKQSSIEAVIDKYDINDDEAQDRIKWYILAVTDTPKEVRWEAAKQAENYYVQPLLVNSVEEIPQKPPSATKTGDEKYSPQEFIREYTGAIIRESNPDSVNLDEEAIKAIRTEAEEYENYGPSAFRSFNKHLDKMSKITDSFKGVNQMMKASQKPFTTMEPIKNSFATMGASQIAADMLKKQDISTAIGSLEMSSSPVDFLKSDIVSPSEISVKSGRRSRGRESAGPSKAELERQVERLQQRVAKLEKQLEE